MKPRPLTNQKANNMSQENTLFEVHPLASQGLSRSTKRIKVSYKHSSSLEKPSTFDKIIRESTHASN
jgi:hypothetical protein